MTEIGADGWLVVAIFVGAVGLLGFCAWHGRKERRRRWAGIESEERLR